MIPILFDKYETSFDHNGLGRLNDCISCAVTEELNGEYTLDMEYPVDGNIFDKIEIDSIIGAVPSDNDNMQLFMVAQIDINMNTAVIHANHISYRLSGLPVRPFDRKTTLNAAINAIIENSVTNDSWEERGFTLTTDKTVTGKKFAVEKAQSVMKCIGDLVDTFGGDLYRDNFDIKLMASRGEDNGVSIMYGKNMTAVDAEYNSAANGYYYYYNNGSISHHPWSAGESSNEHPYPYFEIKDATIFYDDEPTNAQLVSDANSASQNLVFPKVAIDVSFVDLGKFPEYEEFFALETTHMGDTVHVYHEALGLDYTSRVVKTVYNVLSEQYDSVSVGTVQSSLADTIASISSNVSSGSSASPGGSGSTYTISKDGNTVTLRGSGGDTSSFTDANTTYALSQNGQTVTLTGSDGKSTSATLTDNNTTYALSQSGQTVTLTGSDGKKTTATLADNNTTYALSQSGNTVTLTGSDGKTSSATFNDKNTTYGLSQSGKTITLTGSDGKTSSATYTDTAYALSQNGNTVTLTGSDGKTSSATFTDKNTTYALSQNGNTVTLTGSDGKTSSATLSDKNTTYALSQNGNTVTLTGSDGKTSSATFSDKNTTYSLTQSGNTVTLTGSDGSTSTITVDTVTVEPIFAQATGTAATSSVAKSVTQVPLTKLDVSNGDFSIASNGLKVLNAGLYRISASCYIGAASTTSRVGVYVRVGSAWSTAKEVNAAYLYKPNNGAGDGAVPTASKIVSLNAGDIVFLGARCGGAEGTCYPNNAATYLLVEKIA